MKKCRYCGREGHGAFTKEQGEWACKSMLQCFNRLVMTQNRLVGVVKDLRNTGLVMSNICFNLSQQKGAALTQNVCDTCSSAYQDFDCISRLARKELSSL